MIVPWQAISDETLQQLLEEYVSRDGTDYGESEVSVTQRVSQVHQHLQKGRLVIWFDEAGGTTNVLSKDQLPKEGAE